MWLHVERTLSLLNGDAAGNKNAGIGENPIKSIIGAQSQEPAETPVALKDERSAYFHHFLGNTAEIERPEKAEPERRLDFCRVVKSEESGSDVLSKQNTDTIFGVEETVDTTHVPSSKPHSTTRRGGISSASRPASKKAKARPARAFAYGLQPFKAVHNVVPHVSNFFHMGYTKSSV
jgi:hypothetical protein